MRVGRRARGLSASGGDAADAPATEKLDPMPEPGGEPTEPAMTDSHGDLEPSPEEIQISARILIHLSGLPRLGPEDIPLPGFTQAGISQAVGKGQAAVSNALLRLVDGGAVWVERSHVQRQNLRLKVYRLTPRGEMIARQIRLRFGL